MSTYMVVPRSAGPEEIAPAERRPPNSPGWGRLVATKTGSFISERDPRERVTINKGTTRVAPGHWIARERPELFRPVDRRDGRTYRAHSANLERARQDLERGGTATRRVSDQRRTGVLPAPRPTASLFRAPRSRRPARVLP